jgi:hypothetical protein
VPFLRAGKPGLLLWHFTDQFYHTDQDRLDKVSAATLENVGVCALASAMTLTTADGEVARLVVQEVEEAALRRLATEHELSSAAVEAGDGVEEQALIIRTWTDWYVAALSSARDIEVGGSSPQTIAAVEAAMERVAAAGERYARALDAALTFNHGNAGAPGSRAFPDLAEVMPR